MHPSSGNDRAFGASYTSVLTNITWIDKDNEFVKALLEYKPERLSIHFNVDLFTGERKWSNFTWGRITGAIGVSGNKTSPFFIGRGRMMRTRDANAQSAPFIVDNLYKKYEQHPFLTKLLT